MFGFESGYGVLVFDRQGLEAVGRKDLPVAARPGRGCSGK